MPAPSLRRQLWTALHERPDPVFADIGVEGERLLAKMRVLASALMIFMPMINLVLGGDTRESLFGLIGVGFVLLLSQLWLSLAQMSRRPRWLPFVSAFADVSLVSLVLLMLGLNQASSGLNSMVVFACYFLAIMGTLLRHDTRVTASASLLATAQYFLLGVFLLNNGQGLVSVEYGRADWSSVLQRSLLLLTGGLVATIAALRMQRSFQLSSGDALTGLPNRSFLNLRLPEMIDQARRSGQSLTLALCDLDHFRGINNELGHSNGDRALRHCAALLGAGLQREDSLLRIGGEEFLLVLWLPSGAAFERLEAIRARLASTPFEPGDGQEPRRITVSIGAVCCPTEAATLSALMKLADQRVQRAKSQGRNQVVVRD